jgi:hypothetical protein
MDAEWVGSIHNDRRKEQDGSEEEQRLYEAGRDAFGCIAARAISDWAQDSNRLTFRVGSPSPSVPTLCGLVPMEVGI